MAMSETNIHEQIGELNRKMDLILESIDQQKRNREEFEDLVADLSIVAKDAFRQTVVLLDKSEVELDHDRIPMLFVKVLQNLDTFYEMLEMIESARDFMKDISPVLHQVGLDAVHKMNEFEEKGYFDIVRNLTQPGVLAGLGNISKAVATVKRDDSIDNKSLLGLLKQMNSPGVRRTLSYMLRLAQAIDPENAGSANNANNANTSGIAKNTAKN